MHIKNKSNVYAEAVGPDVFERCPKTVFAAIAVSALTVGGDYLDEARDRLLAEWWVLYDNKIVEQKPPIPRAITSEPA